MDLSKVIVLLQVVLALLSNPQTAHNPQVQVLAQQAIATAQTALKAVPVTPTPTVAPVQHIAYKGTLYTVTPANMAALQSIQTIKNNCADWELKIQNMIDDPAQSYLKGPELQAQLASVKNECALNLTNAEAALKQ